MSEISKSTWTIDLLQRREKLAPMLITWRLSSLQSDTKREKISSTYSFNTISFHQLTYINLMNGILVLTLTC